MEERNDNVDERRKKSRMKRMIEIRTMIWIFLKMDDVDRRTTTSMDSTPVPVSNYSSYQSKPYNHPRS